MIKLKTCQISCCSHLLLLIYSTSLIFLIITSIYKHAEVAVKQILGIKIFVTFQVKMYFQVCALMPLKRHTTSTFFVVSPVHLSLKNSCIFIQPQKQSNVCFVGPGVCPRSILQLKCVCACAAMCAVFLPFLLSVKLLADSRLAI